MDIRTAALTSCLSLVLCACGGGGGGGESTLPAPLRTLSGTVAGNVPLADYGINIHSPTGLNSGLGTPPTTTGPDGRYSATSALGTPMIISANARQGASEPQGEPKYQRLLSITHQSGTANVTPLTDLLVARLLNRKPEGVDFPAAFELRNRSEADVRSAQQQVLAYLRNRPSKDNGNITSPVDVSAVTDFVSMPLAAVPGDPYFEALKRFHDSLMDSETIDGVEEHMLFGSDGPANLGAMFALDFPAECTVQSIVDNGMPRGTTRITLDRRAFTAGSLDLPFQTGDRLVVDAGTTVTERWGFAFTASGARVDLSIFAGRVSEVMLSVPGKSSSRCVPPQSEVSLSGKHPSLFALIRLFEPFITPSFQCANPITFPGFQSGANLAVIDANGALRINGPGGPALHLPSLNISISMLLNVAGDQVGRIQLERFSASRSFRGGSDAFVVSLSDVGQITGLRLARRNEQSGQTEQTCGSI